MAYKYIHGDVADSVFRKSTEDFLETASQADPLILTAILGTVIASSAETKQAAVNTFDTITEALKRG